MTSQNKRREDFAQLKEQAKLNDLKFGISMLYLGVPSLLDSIGSSLQIVSLLLIPASV